MKKIRLFLIFFLFFTDLYSSNHNFSEWLIEFKEPRIDLDGFTDKLDLALKATNSDYEAKRYKDLILEAPKVHIASKGLFFNWMRARGKLGGQNKVPRLYNKRDYLDELLSMNS